MVLTTSGPFIHLTRYNSVVGIINFVLIGVASILVRPLGTAQQTGGKAGIVSWYLFKNPRFVILFMFGLITTFGYMVSE